MKTFWYVLKFVVLIVIICLLAYWLLFAPQQRRIRAANAENAATEMRIADTKAQIDATPAAPRAEKDLWQLIETRNQEVLFDESSMIKALADLAELANRNGAELTAVSIEDLPQSEQLQQQNRTRRGRGQEPIEEEPVKIGESTVKVYPVRLAIRGGYPAWTRVMAAMSTELVPVILDGVDTVPGDGGPLMIVKLRVPARFGDAPIDIDPSQPAPAVAYSHELGEKYRLSELESQPVAQFVSRNVDPFPVIEPDVEPREPLEQPNWSLTAVIQRGDQYVAMVNDQIVTVGDELDGHRLVEITPTAAIFKRVN